ncbi:MAG: HIT domain-containing protein [Chloroflexi bacterium]|nr:MAG: HIT domain-containing protein [Chloroflexota bacterium]
MSAHDATPECIFCQIVCGALPSAKVAEDEYTLAFIARPSAVEGHTLVIPKRHSRNIFDIAPDDLRHVIITVKAVSGDAIRHAWDVRPIDTADLEMIARRLRD